MKATNLISVDKIGKRSYATISTSDPLFDKEILCIQLQLGKHCDRCKVYPIQWKKESKSKNAGSTRELNGPSIAKLGRRVIRGRENLGFM